MGKNEQHQMNELRTKLAAGKACIGAWLTLPSAEAAEVMAAMGFLAAERHGAAPFARIAEHDPYLARRLFDSGAQGLIVSTVEDASALSGFLDHCLYPPRGRRGVGLSRCNLWGDTFDAYMSDFRPLLIAQIETAAGVAAIEDIMALDAVDGFFLGPYDLSASIGKAGDFESREMHEAIERVRQAASKAGKMMGIHQIQPDAEALAGRVREGYQLIAYASDAIAMRHSLDAVRSLPRDTQTLPRDTQK